MQDKETVDEAEEALTSKDDSISKVPDKKETDVKKESSKDGKFAFKKMKQPKKEKTEKSKPDKSKSDKSKLDKKKYEGEGVIFKGKLIGVECVGDARGDVMCQEAMTGLKLKVKNLGPHKRKITVQVSLQGIKIKDEKTGAVMYHHPITLISFISQDITDARAFGYVFGSTSEQHQFIAIKTEKPAFQVVVTIRELFQTVLFHKQQVIDIAKNESSKNEVSPSEPESETAPNSSSTVQNEQQSVNQNIYAEVLLTEPVAMIDEPPNVEMPTTTVDDLLGLQDELVQLQMGIEQMDSSIAAVTTLNSEVPVLENDPFDTSFVLGPKRDSFAVPMPTPVPITIPLHTDDNPFNDFSANGDKYAVFNVIDSGPSIFEAPALENEDQAAAEMKQLEEEIAKKSAPAKPPRLSKAESTDISIFAELDPLGKDRPYVDKTAFFQDVKNPPKKVLNDLVDPSKEASRVLDVDLLVSPVPFPVDFDNAPPPALPSSSLPNAFPSNFKLSLVNGNGDVIYHKPKARSGSEPPQPHFFNALQNTSGNSHQQLNVNCVMANLNHTQMSTSSSPIPIPPRANKIEKDDSLSNGSYGSPYSKSPQPYALDSPSNVDYFHQNYSNLEGSSPTGYRNGLHHAQYLNGENGNPALANAFNLSKNSNSNGFSNSPNNNGVSRPRPRPSLNKGGSVQNGGRTTSSHSLSSDSSSDYEMISKENMQSITSMLLSNGHRLRAQSLNIESNNLKLPSEKNIFAKKNDPFADDFFYSLPKKASHLTQTEIPEYV